MDREKEEEKEMMEAETRSVYNWGTRVFNYGKRRVTDIKGNSRVIFPSKARSLEVESAFQTLRLELLAEYMDEKCGKGGGRWTTSPSPRQLGSRVLRRG